MGSAKDAPEVLAGDCSPLRSSALEGPPRWLTLETSLGRQALPLLSYETLSDCREVRLRTKTRATRCQHHLSLKEGAAMWSLSGICSRPGE